MSNRKFFVATSYDVKENLELISKYVDVWHTSHLLLIDFCTLTLTKDWINKGFIKSILSAAGEISQEPIELKDYIIDQILKSIQIQLNNYLMYLKNEDTYLKNNVLNVMTIVSLISFKITKGHFLANGNKRTAFMVMIYIISFFGYSINNILERWTVIYSQWIHIASITNLDISLGINKTYDLVLNNLLKERELMIKNNKKPTKAIARQAEAYWKNNNILDELSKNPMIKKIMENLLRLNKTFVIKNITLLY